MIIINIETSTSVCSVAVGNGNECIFSKKDESGMNHALLLSTFVEEALEELRSQNLKPDAIAVSSGPGSYTGLRIGVSTAKGLCFGYGVPLIAVPTLRIMQVEALKFNQDENVNFVAMIDARRMEVYDEIFDYQGNTIQETQADIIDAISFNELLSNQKVVFFGNGSDKCKEIIQSANASFISGVHPLAENMISLSSAKFEKGVFADVAYFEPFYLKEFQATTPKKKV